jgi:hypothetical protein
MHFHYKIFIHEKCLQNENDKFEKSLSRPSITDAKAHYWAAARRLRSPDLEFPLPPATAETATPLLFTAAIVGWHL